MSDNMLWEGGTPITLTAGAAIQQYAPVTLEATGKLAESNAITDICVGVAMEPAAADLAKIPVMTQPGVKAVLMSDGNAVITAGTFLMPSATVPGRVRLAAGAGSTRIAYALTGAAATSGAFVQVLWLGQSGGVV
jgi:hypothetical protein